MSGFEGSSNFGSDEPADQEARLESARLWAEQNPEEAALLRDPNFVKSARQFLSGEDLVDITPDEETEPNTSQRYRQNAGKGYHGFFRGL